MLICRYSHFITLKPQRDAKLSLPSKYRKIIWIYKLFKGAIILPTAEQALKCVYLSQALTTVYKPIYMVRLDERKRIAVHSRWR
ncbi:DUF6888 family protein [Tolypothrix sp. NIES-4075]|uniref:DUF6888 family protein n=1 Tax=Tolypothrix sp. NIES-4075 TaxID=2005459 RepID=UPI00352DCF62